MRKVALVLKDNAYGHGLETMAALAAEAGVRHAVVRTMAEAEALAGRFETVLVLSDLPARRPAAGVRVVVNDRSHLAKLPEGTAVELKIDTGMHRNGIPMEEAEAAAEEAAKRGLKIVGVMTHYRSAD
ncbi:alanine racemase, partial [Hydrogenimonas sp.]